MQNKYSTDANNRLIIRNNGKNLPVNGSFSTDEHNRLIYWLNETPGWRRKYQLPEKIVFEGSWKFNSNYDLELELNQYKSDFQDILLLKGEVISCEGDKLVFEIKSAAKNGLSSLRLIKLSGIWGADEANQILFSVSKKGSPDTLTLQGAWKLNKNQQITYTYEKSGLKTKTKTLSTLVFSGFWQISSKNQLTYIISRGANSKFDFKAQIETPDVHPKKGVIKYRLGAGLKETQPEKLKIISLYGIWKISRELGLSFDMEYEKGRIYSIIFGAEINFGKRNRVIFNLKDESGEALGINAIFTHRFLKQLDAELFLRLKHAEQESGIDAGIRIPF